MQSNGNYLSLLSQYRTRLTQLIHAYGHIHKAYIFIYR